MAVAYVYKRTLCVMFRIVSFFFFQAEDGIRDGTVTGVQTCALPISPSPRPSPGLHGAPHPGSPRRTGRRGLVVTPGRRSEEHTSELSHSSISYAVFCLKKKKKTKEKKKIKK